ncbi:MAG: 4-hydroxybutyrate dehydrogenase [Thiotrichales bacterium]|nr:4-hydroxybutyrate dehydrogenase [Thiotrichales bacterium]|tara:strand:- start:5915 stop:7048 length:1134 start_codon:yes stop_codon:yes gene_type:complete
MALINYLTKIQFDHGSVSLLGEELKALGMKAPMIVTDRGVRDAGLLDPILNSNDGSSNWAIFDETPGNPTEAAVESALDHYVERQCDGLIAVGGGSSIDLAKGVALLATHQPPLEQYAAILGGVERITSDVAPVIAIPTTAGTGSEVGRAALITLRDGRKLGFLAPNMIPNVAICDPDLTLGLPPGLTAATGMDALTHCIETFLSPRVNPPADAIALDGVGRAMRNIERAVNDGSDRDARWNMMMASLQGGMTFQKGLGAVHAMSHPLGGLAEPILHHGTLNAVILPPVLKFNADHAGDKYEHLRLAMELPPGTEVANAIESLNQRLGLPANLRDMGVTDDVLPRMVAGAVADHSTATNPRPADADDYEALFAEAMG